MTKTKQDNDVIDHTGASTLKMILNYRDRLERVQFFTNTREDNDMIDCTSVVYTKNDTELS